MARRLPIFILIDTSGSMRGEPIESVRSGLQALNQSLRKDPYALETVYISIITFDREAKLLVPLTSLEKFAVPEIPVPETSPTNMGEALELLCGEYAREVVLSTKEKKGDWLPIAVIMTDGSPSDTKLYNEMVQKIKSYQFAQFIALAAGPKAKTEPIKALTKDIYALDTMESHAFSKFWKWVSVAIRYQSQSVGTPKYELPPPPEEINLVF